jgi:Holliday junction DNA helicase RuvA
LIIGIEGSVSKKDITNLHLKTASGITYKINISVNSYNQIQTDNISLHTTLIVREDAQVLYGFYDVYEKEMFDKLIKLNGVGPSTALAICSTFTPKSFFSAISSNDINAIKAVPGIGPKSAKRILVELGDFKPSFETSSNQSYSEALMALESLGFKKEKIQKVLSSCASTDTASLVKEALKIINS